MSALELEVYEIFKTRFTGAEEKYEQKKDFLSTKQDITEVRLEIKEAKSDTIKWMFIFWLASTLTTLGGLVDIVKLMIKN